jgi:coenzyme PQQ synthesis protein D (PqqD)
MTAENEVWMRLRTEDVATRDYEDEKIILDLRNSVYLSTNSTASILWSHLERGATRAAMIEALQTNFEVDPSQAAHDVDLFVSDLRQRGLITDQPGPAS